jgi:catechol-2,3-dioxygenase
MDGGRDRFDQERGDQVTINRMNHAVLYVRDASRTAAFYTEVLGFRPVSVDDDGRFAFLRAPGSANHHDIAFFTVGAQAGPPTEGRFVGLYHIAWEVDRIEDLAALRTRLREAGSLVGASDHGVSKSLYAKDPDGIEFEVMWRVPAEQWGEAEHDAVVQRLDLDAEVARFGTS